MGADKPGNTGESGAANGRNVIDDKRRQQHCVTKPSSICSGAEKACSRLQLQPAQTLTQTQCTYLIRENSPREGYAAQFSPSKKNLLKALIDCNPTSVLISDIDLLIVQFDAQ